MNPYIEFLNVKIPMYGFMILLGILLANSIAFYLVKRFEMDFNDLIILESYSFAGGVIGAKLLYLITSFSYIDWRRIFELSYLNTLINGGFVFYGGFIGGTAGAFIAGKIHRIDFFYYIKHCIGLVPFVHSFGRIGCFCAGCCYGIPYDNIFAVEFRQGSFAPAGVKLFPVQVVEAIGLMMIAITILLLDILKNFRYTVELYLFLYSVLRFFLEYLRYDYMRGRYLVFSTSQWISLVLFLISAILLIRKKEKNCI